LPKRPLLAN